MNAGITLNKKVADSSDCYRSKVLRSWTEWNFDEKIGDFRTFHIFSFLTKILKTSELIGIHTTPGLSMSNPWKFGKLWVKTSSVVKFWTREVIKKTPCITCNSIALQFNHYSLMRNGVERLREIQINGLSHTSVVADFFQCTVDWIYHNILGSWSLWYPRFFTIAFFENTCCYIFLQRPFVEFGNRSYSC